MSFLLWEAHNSIFYMVFTCDLALILTFFLNLH